MPVSLENHAIQKIKTLSKYSQYYSYVIRPLAISMLELNLKSVKLPGIDGYELALREDNEYYYQDCLNLDTYLKATIENIVWLWNEDLEKYCRNHVLYTYRSVANGAMLCWPDEMRNEFIHEAHWSKRVQELIAEQYQPYFDPQATYTGYWLRDLEA